MLDIMQIDGEGSAVGRFSLGKEGEVIVYIPVALKGAVTIKNGSGDMEIDSLVASKLAIDNDSGYAELNHVTAEELEISSSSGDVKLFNGNIADFQIGTSSGSDDVTVRLDGVSYTTETSACKQGKIGSGGYSLTVNSDSSTVVIH